jgi:hypothetical protein
LSTIKVGNKRQGVGTIWKRSLRDGYLDPSAVVIRSIANRPPPERLKVLPDYKSNHSDKPDEYTQQVGTASALSGGPNLTSTLTERSA